MGLPWWLAHSYTPSSYFRTVDRDKKRDATPERINNRSKKKARYRKKMKDLYGGRPDSNIVARGRWILAREQNISPDNS